MSNALPGVSRQSAIEPREVLLSNDGVITTPIIVDGNLATDGKSPTQAYDIRVGWLMGRVTATGRWTPCKRTRTKAFASGGVTSAAGDFTVVPVDDASSFKVNDVITVGNDVNLVVKSVDYANNRLTVDNPIAFAADESVFAQDGSGTCRGVLLDFTRLRSDDNNSPVHKTARLLVQGLVNVNKLLGDTASIRLDTNAKLAGIRFSDEH